MRRKVVIAGLCLVALLCAGFNLMAHHFDPEGLLGVVEESLRVARIAVLINDLIRSRVHLGLVYAGLPLFRGRITWNDAPASVRQATGEDKLPALKLADGTVITHSRAILDWVKQQPPA